MDNFYFSETHQKKEISKLREKRTYTHLHLMRDIMEIPLLSSLGKKVVIRC